MSSHVFCCAVGVYDDSLEYGRRYAVLRRESRQLVIRDSRGRKRAYPGWCFSDGQPPEIVQLTHDDPKEVDGLVEVSIRLDSGECRWLWAATPERLAAALSQQSYLAIVPMLDESSLRRVVTELLHHNELTRVSLRV